MVSKFYIQGKIDSVHNSIGYIAKKASPLECADLHFLTETVKGAIENAAHHLDDMQDFAECRVMIFRLTMHLKNKFTQIKDGMPSEALNDVRWCLENIGCIFVELGVSDDELKTYDWCYNCDEDFSIEETHSSLMQPEDSEAEIPVK